VARSGKYYFQSGTRGGIHGDPNIIDADMTKQYFHEISDDEYKRLCNERKTWIDIMETYQQPKWCSYPDALEGILGCWGLIYREMKDEKYCLTCELHKDA